VVVSRDLQEKESDCAQHVSKAIWSFGKNRMANSWLAVLVIQTAGMWYGYQDPF
jgi:hypothetical protein